MTWLITNIKTTLIFLTILIIISGANYIYITILKKNQAEQLQLLQTKLITQCKKAQEITQETNDALQKDRNSIAAQLSVLKRMHPAACVHIVQSSNNSSRGNQYARSNGLSSEWLYDYAAECETYRTEVIELKTFIQHERAE